MLTCLVLPEDLDDFVYQLNWSTALALRLAYNLGFATLVFLDCR